MNATISLYSRNIYGHAPHKLSLLSDLVTKHSIICIQEHLVTADHSAILDRFPGKDYFLQPAIRNSSVGRPSGGILIIADSNLQCTLIDSCDYFSAIRVPGPNGFIVISVYLPTNYRDVLSERRYTKACARLGRLAEQYKSEKIIICGDFNCQLLDDDRFFTILRGCLPDAMAPVPKSQSFTFVHSASLATSDIDHFFVNFLLPTGIKAIVDSEHNCSDHLGISLMVPFSTYKRCPGRSWFIKSEWQRIDQSLYKDILDSTLAKIKVPFHLLTHGQNEDRLALNIFCSEIVHSMKLAESAAVPVAKVYPNTRKKGWDNPNVKFAKKRSKFWYELWKDCDKPRSGVVFQCFRHAKKEFKRTVENMQVQQVEKLSCDCRSDPNILWKRFQSNRADADVQSPIPDESWVNHYKDVFAPPPNELDSVYKSELDRQLISAKLRRTDVIVSKWHIEIIVRKLKKNKSPGLDGITPRHLQHGTERLHEYLALLFQMSIEQGLTPANFHGCRTSNILKKNRDPLLCKSYRPITVSSVISKVFEKVLLPHITSHALMGDKQLGFRNGLGCGHAHRLLRRIMRSTSLVKEPLFACSVDISAAFDSVVQSQALWCLLDSGVDPRIVLVLHDWYSHTHIRLALGWETIAGHRKQKLSEPIRLFKGVRQGSALSPIIFNSAIYSVTRFVRGTFFLEGLDLSFISYADDLLLLSSTLRGLQENLRLLVTLYRRIGLRVNIEKTEFIVFSGTNSTNSNLVLDGIRIQQSQSLNYLGITYGQTPRSTRGLLAESVCKSIRSAYGKAVKCKWSFNRFIKSKLFNAVVSPAIWYISPLWEMLSLTERRKIRTTYYRFAKFLLGLPLRFSNTEISSIYGILDPSTKVIDLERRASRRSLSKLYDSPLTQLFL